MTLNGVCKRRRTADVYSEFARDDVKYLDGSWSPLSLCERPDKEQC